MYNVQVSVEHTPSHILPVHVGDPLVCSALSDELMKYGHYVQVYSKNVQYCF